MDAIKVEKWLLGGSRAPDAEVLDQRVGLFARGEGVHKTERHQQNVGNNTLQLWEIEMQSPTPLLQ